MNIPKPEHPRPDFYRTNFENLNGEWEFYLGADDENTYNERIIVPFSWASPLSGIGRDEKGIGHYRKTIEWEPTARGDGIRVFWCFGAVDYECTAFVNGHEVGRHLGAYGAFEFEVTDVILPGRNVLEVRAADFDRRSQTYGKQGYGNIRGIWQTTYLECRAPSFIKSVRFHTSLDGNIDVKLIADAAEAGSVNIKFLFGEEIYDAGVRTLSAGENKLALGFKIDSPRLWSTDDPQLYEGSVLMSSTKGNGVDEVFTYFGVREIDAREFYGRGFKWITLNGEPVYLNGTLDQAFNPTGFFTYPSDEDIQAEVYRLKRIGLNMVRIHIKPEEPRKLYWLDKAGILVMEDMPCFWGEPDEEARARYEQEKREIIERDFNHPGIFAWVVFNESWGLLSSTGDGEEKKRIYTPETQEWVRERYLETKRDDPTRLVEDNSACLYDHVQTDINSWHFYLNGYETVRDHIWEVVSNTRPGSEFNYIGGNKQNDEPLMNSECGMVWGVEGSAGDSDLAWQYHYMLNEYRLHEKMCGFVFTEFHDVVNEFNGYYRMDDTDKDWGYDAYCRGMTLRDLHAKTVVVFDAPPCRTTARGEKIVLPLKLSCFDKERLGKRLSVRWELWHDGLDGREVIGSGVTDAAVEEFGTTDIGTLTLEMADCDALCVLSLWLCDAGEVLSRNFVTFDTRGEAPYLGEGGYSAKSVGGYESAEFEHLWQAQSGGKLCGGGKGFAEYSIDVSDIVGRDEAEAPILPELEASPFDVPDCSCGDYYIPNIAKYPDEMSIFFEAGAKRVLAKDIRGGDIRAIDYMHGEAKLQGDNPNSYLMTGEDKHPSLVNAYINGVKVSEIYLPDDPADARGALSWHYQKDDRHLDEAGSYGYLCRVDIPSRLIPAIVREGKFTLRLETDDRIPGGLALYGRNSGRYPIDIIVRTR